MTRVQSPETKNQLHKVSWHPPTVACVSHVMTVTFTRVVHDLTVSAYAVSGVARIAVAFGLWLTVPVQLALTHCPSVL